MTATTPSLDSSHWYQIHRDIERYELLATLVKLFCCAIVVLMLAMEIPVLLILGIVVTLWIQEALLKTFQSRLMAYLTDVELGKCESSTLYTWWEQQQVSAVGACFGYLKSALKPTVLISYGCLGVVVFSFGWLS